MNECEDSLLGGKVRLLQKEDGYRTAIDPIFLAAAIPAKAGELVLDLGCGVGTVSLCLHARISGLTISGLDVQKPLVDLARRNSALNNCGDDLYFLDGDLLAPLEDIPGARFDHVMANPPYFAANSGNPSPDAAKAIANVEGKAVLVDWVRAAHRALKPRGSVTFIHRADRVEDLLAALHGGFGELVIFPLWPACGKDAKRIIVAARKGIASPARISPGLVLHKDDGNFTDQAQSILKKAFGLSML
jgi:tRNA1(Val) A37 N6-methylase TrmN6